MSQSLARVIIHLTFSTKERRPWLRDHSLRQELFGYLAGVFKKLESPAIIVGGVEDHIHAMFALSRVRAVMDVVRNVKADSSKWIRRMHCPSHGFS